MSMAADPPTPNYDWSARVRSTALEALRYSRFVALMKRVLSLGAFLIIAAVLAFFFVQRMPRQLQMSYERLGHIENDLTMAGVADSRRINAVCDLFRGAISGDLDLLHPILPIR